MKISPRSQKLAGVVQEKIGPIIQQFLSPDEIGFLTITAVEISGDLEWGHIFLSSIGAKKGWLDKLNGVSGKISHELAKEVESRRTLKFIFKEDQSIKKSKGLNF